MKSLILWWVHKDSTLDPLIKISCGTWHKLYVRRNKSAFIGKNTAIC